MASTMVKLSKKIGRLFLCRIFFLLPAAAAAGAIHDAVHPDAHANEIRLLQLELDDLRAIVNDIRTATRDTGQGQGHGQERDHARLEQEHARDGVFSSKDYSIKRDKCKTQIPAITTTSVFYFNGLSRNVARSTTASNDSTLVGNITFQAIDMSRGFFNARIATKPPNVNEYNFVCTFDPGSNYRTAHGTLTYEWPRRDRGPAWLQIGFDVEEHDDGTGRKTNGGGSGGGGGDNDDDDDDDCIVSRINVVGAYPYSNATENAGVYSFVGLPRKKVEHGIAPATKTAPAPTTHISTPQVAAARRRRAEYCAKGDHPDDCAALVDLGVATDWQRWAYNSNWLTNKSVCDWELVGCDSVGRVKVLALSFNNMVGGPIPASMSKLTELQDLDLEGNHITGPLTEALVTALTSLVEFGLGNNNFSGVLPATLCDLRALQGPACDLSGNNWRCPVPTCAAQHCGATCKP